MQEIAISKFKRTCVAALERVRTTREHIRITRFGKPIAEIVPCSPEPKNKTWIGSMEGTILFQGDIISPASEEDWEILKW
jgi:antitoxin (DNA-binding transcriptional repressor) of toxin-antitoxin stability system